jgi:hypothetical protein
VNFKLEVSLIISINLYFNYANIVLHQYLERKIKAVRSVMQTRRRSYS